MKDIYEMAREANRYADTHADSTDCDWPIVRDKRFAELVRADSQRTWVGLTDEEVENIFNNWPTYHLDHEDFARAIEAKLREKNS